MTRLELSCEAPGPRRYMQIRSHVAYTKELVLALPESTEEGAEEQSPLGFFSEVQ